MAIIDQSKLSKEVKEKYTIKNDAFVQVAKNNPKDLVTCEIGDTKDLTKFQNQMKICRWGDTPDNNEVNVSLRLIENEIGTAEVSTNKDKIIWKKGNIETHYYDVLEDEGGKEMEVVFLSKPVSNVVQMSLNTKGVEFFYQPPLTQAEIDQGCERPENVVGSYAVYASEQKTNWVGGKEYKCGIVGHIYRPKIIDSAGTEVWGVLNIANGILTVTIPQDFLNTAMYPVRHAAGLTFGYITAGASKVDMDSGSQSEANNTLTHTAVTGDTVTLLTVSAAKVGTTNSSIGLAVYSFVAGAPSARLTTEQTISITSVTQGWLNSSALSTAISNGVVYTTAGGHVGAADIYLYYNTGADDISDYNNNSSLPVTWTHADVNNRLLSIYATYTASGGTPANQTNFFQFINV